eukprot:12406923-Karenia_brevis.AAC.1
MDKVLLRKVVLQNDGSKITEIGWYYEIVYLTPKPEVVGQSNIAITRSVVNANEVTKALLKKSSTPNHQVAPLNLEFIGAVGGRGAMAL